MIEKQINTTFRILSSICILLVVAGHADFHIFDLGGMFPYYSFHVMAFLFISGYFYYEESEKDIISYIKRKMCKLMLPYLAWNFFYGLVASVLHFFGFAIGGPINLKTLFLEPFLSGHQFGYNYASWFVPALFLIEILNICMRKILGFLHIKNEWFIASACFLAGIFTVWLSINGHVWGYFVPCPAHRDIKLQRPSLQRRMVYGLCQWSIYPLYNMHHRNRILAADFQNIGPPLQSPEICPPYRRKYLCHYDAPYSRLFAAQRLFICHFGSRHIVGRF